MHFSYFSLSDAKRLIGRAFTDKTVESFLKRQVWEFQIDCDEENRPVYKVICNFKLKSG